MAKVVLGIHELHETMTLLLNDLLFAPGNLVIRNLFASLKGPTQQSTHLNQA